MNIRRTISYSLPIQEPIREPGASGIRTVGEAQMECVVDVEIDVERIIKRLGALACQSKGGRSREMSGLVVVKRIGTPREVSRKMR
jgi:hypothetical protein